jgi:hypothetical protein
MLLLCTRGQVTQEAANNRTTPVYGTVLRCLERLSAHMQVRIGAPFLVSLIISYYFTEKRCSALGTEYIASIVDVAPPPLSPRQFRQNSANAG